MRNFARALREALRHWPAMTAAICCSLCVAALWCANIAVLFPIIQTTLHGQSLQDWNRQRIVAAKNDLAAQEASVADADRQLKQARGEQRDRLRNRLEAAQTQATLAAAAVAAAEGWQPIVNLLPDDAFKTVVSIVAMVIVATVLKQIMTLANVILVARVTQSIVRDVRCRIFDKALSFDREGFNRYGVSGFTSHLIHTTDMLSWGLTSFLGGAIAEPLRILACLAGAFYISWRLTLASLLLAPIAAYCMLQLNRQIRGLSTKMLDRSMGFHHVMLEVFSSITTVQAYVMEPYEQNRFRDSTGQYRRTAVKAAVYNSLASPVTELLGMGMLCIGLIVSAYLVLNKQTHIFGVRMTDQPLSIAAVTTFFGLLIGAADPLRKLSTVATAVNTGMAGADLLYPILDYQTRLVEPSDPVAFPQRHSSVEFRDVTFSYDGLHNILHGVNLTINAGEHVAVVGPNGGGKSTLINLMCRFFDPQKGQVLIDGVDLRDARLGDVRRRIALVNQQSELFNESITHNIRYGRWDATDDEVVAAAKLARAHEFISSFPDGYQTLVGPNGQRLSGGQRQRIALARAFLRDAQILILDEATSQIDVDSERLIHEALADYGAHRTLIMITHRESTLDLATRIVRIEHGILTPLVEAETCAA